MSYKSGMARCAAALLVFLLLISALAVGGTSMVKVVVSGATIRRSPDATSRVIEAPDVGSVYEVKGKSGSWYEIECRSNIGIPINGYIHEMFVEPTGETPTSSAGPERHVRTVIKAAGLAALTRAGYAYEDSGIIWDEYSTTRDVLDDGTGVGLGLGLGILTSENVELTADVSYFSKTLSGMFGFGLPNQVLYNDISYDEIATEPSLSEMTFTLGINYHFISSGAVRPYMGAGLTYLRTKIDLVDDFMYIDTYSEIDTTHVIDIVSGIFKDETINSAGLTVRAGADFAFSTPMAGFVEATYVLAPSKELGHGIASSLYPNADDLKIDMGGARFTVGLKFFP